MDAELDTFVTALYVKIDDALRIHPELRQWRPEVGLAPKLSDAELVTLAVLQALLGFTSETRFLRHARAQLRPWFPYLPHQSGYNKRLRKAQDQLRAMIRLLAADTECFEDDTWVMDSTPVECGRSRPTALRSDLAALLSGMLGSYYDQPGLSPADLRSDFLGGRASATDRAIERAVGRGEIDPARLTPRIVNLPFDLWRHEVMMTLKPVPDHVLNQIVDDIFIPLVARREEPGS